MSATAAVSLDDSHQRNIHEPSRYLTWGRSLLAWKLLPNDSGGFTLSDVCSESGLDPNAVVSTLDSHGPWHTVLQYVRRAVCDKITRL
jgi:hypothetical protein